MHVDTEHYRVPCCTDVEDTWTIFTGRHSGGDLYAHPYKVKKNLRKEVSV